MKHLLMIYASQTGRTEALAQAVADGAAEFSEEVELRVRRAQAAGIDDLFWADGLVIGTPENFGYMAGLVKDFLDRTYYPAQGKTVGLPYAIFVSAGNDGTGAVTAIERIALGYQWTRVAQPIVIKGEINKLANLQCRELGQTLAAGLALGVF